MGAATSCEPDRSICEPQCKAKLHPHAYKPHAGLLEAIKKDAVNPYKNQDHFDVIESVLMDSYENFQVQEDGLFWGKLVGSAVDAAGSLSKECTTGSSSDICALKDGSDGRKQGGAVDSRKVLNTKQSIDSMHVEKGQEVAEEVVQQHLERIRRSPFERLSTRDLDDILEPHWPEHAAVPLNLGGTVLTGEKYKLRTEGSGIQRLKTAVQSITVIHRMKKLSKSQKTKEKMGRFKTVIRSIAIVRFWSKAASSVSQKAISTNTSRQTESESGAFYRPEEDKSSETNILKQMSSQEADFTNRLWVSYGSSKLPTDPDASQRSRSAPQMKPPVAKEASRGQVRSASPPRLQWLAPSPDHPVVAMDAQSPRSPPLTNLFYSETPPMAISHDRHGSKEASGHECFSDSSSTRHAQIEKTFEERLTMSLHM